MFEFDQYDRALDREPPSMPRAPYALVDDIDRLSFLAWGEHCVECAAPACFSTCDLYEPRPDRRCRRFVFGTRRNPHFPARRGYGAEVVFRKWAKLEARGNTRMQPAAAVLRRERALGAALPLVNALGRFVYWITRDRRWSHLSLSWLERMARRLHRKSCAEDPPDAFVVEVYNPGERPVHLQLLMTVTRAQVPSHRRMPAPFVAALELAPGYTRHVVERARFQAVTASGLPFDVGLLPAGDAATRLVFLTADFVTFRTCSSAPGARPDVKCVVFDLDHTLWQGILLENAAVVLRPGVKEVLHTLDERGILLSIVSKNSHEYAWAKLEALGIAEYFLHPQINWMPKSHNLRTLAQQLNLGIDTFAFVDDNPFELEEVARAFPAVECVLAEALAQLPSRPRYRGSTSAEARMRRQFYQDAIQREQVEQSYGEDYLAFLAACQIQLDIRLFAAADLDRVAELVQRTNQLNFSGRKYLRDEVTALLADPTLEKYVLCCRDRFGSYGTVGFSMVSRRPGQLAVEDFMLSCRVQGKFLEQAFFHFLMSARNPEGASRLVVNFRKTDRNTPAQNVLKALGFVAREQERGMVLDVTARPLTCDSIGVTFVP
ncbi:MAG: HAD-IIIC family phosphatase [Planctomycetes bacterium]|nr:HAD-IIIC family phosphatase [Planctomycetota bacterium]